MRKERIITPHEPAIENYEINERVKKIREYYGLNQTEFGAKIGLSLATINNIENKKTRVTVQTIMLLCDELNANVDYLLAGIGEPLDVQSEHEDELLREYLAMTPAERVCLYEVLQVLRQNPLYYDPSKDPYREEDEQERQRFNAYNNANNNNDGETTGGGLPAFYEELFAQAKAQAQSAGGVRCGGGLDVV